MSDHPFMSARSPRASRGFWRRCAAAGLAVVAMALSAGCDRNAPSKNGPGGAAYPTKSVTLICPWAAGGGTDRLARFMADQLQQALGQPFIVVNKVGGGGAVGHSAGAVARPDGYTLTMATFELSTMHWMGISDLTWQSFTPVIQLNADAAALLVRADAPWRSLADWIDHVKTNPGKLQMSGTETGGAWDLARAGFMLAAGLKPDAVRWIPAKGSAPAILELLGNHIDSICCSVPEAAAQIEAGQLRVLAVMAPARLADFPNLPTLKESGVDWEAVGWRGLVMPKETPPEVVQAIGQAAERIAQSPAYKTFMQKNGFAAEIRSASEFAAFLEQQDAQWKSVIDAVGYRRR